MIFSFKSYICVCRFSRHAVHHQPAMSLVGDQEDRPEYPAVEYATQKEEGAVYTGTNVVPRTPHGTVLHVDVKEGDVANRILTVGDFARAERIAASFSGKVFKHTSSRGFTTYTGLFDGTPISIIAIGMGIAMMDFMVREVRQIVSGTMLVVRYGTCGLLQPDVSPGSVVVATEGSILVIRNPDAFLPQDGSPPPPYITFRPQASDAALSAAVARELGKELGPDKVKQALNVSADSFYSSQGRRDELFHDRSEGVLSWLHGAYPGVLSMEMETFQLLALANASTTQAVIRASAASIGVANRATGQVCGEELLARLERDGGRAVLRALASMPLE